MNRELKKELTAEKNAWKDMINRMNDKEAIVDQNPESNSLINIKNEQRKIEEEEPSPALLY